MSRRVLLCGLAQLTCLILAAGAHAAGGSYVLAGGTPREQETVRAALEASAFNWSLVPARVTIHIDPVTNSYASPGEVWLNAGLLDAGTFSWGVAQHEYAHQVDFFLLDDAKRSRLLGLLGGRDWCYAVPGLRHAEYGCERFASTLAWAYWPTGANTMKPLSKDDESGAMPVATFRALLDTLIGAPATPPVGATAFSPLITATSRVRGAALRTTAGG